MEKVFEKKMEILNGIYKSKECLSWNELTQLLNELIEITKEPLELKMQKFVDDYEKLANNYYERGVLLKNVERQINQRRDGGF